MIDIIHEIRGITTKLGEDSYSHSITLKKYETQEVLDSAVILSTSPIEECERVRILIAFWSKKYPG